MRKKGKDTGKAPMPPVTKKAAKCGEDKKAKEAASLPKTSKDNSFAILAPVVELLSPAKVLVAHPKKLLKGVQPLLLC